ncbi:MAG: T9SS type A sorting domain-containing protein [candidate division KSB1 bacterium]|nr:T9SS type A sorting domain-containing protein [candidate division KSB1 bacterium]
MDRKKMFGILGAGFLFWLLPCYPGVAGAPVLLLSPDPIYFGKIPTGSAADRDLLIFNVGTDNATIRSIRVQGVQAQDFSIINDPGSVTLRPLQVLVVPLRFSPSATGSRIASIVVEGNAGTLSDSLIGEGINAQRRPLTFERILGGIDADAGSFVQHTNDGGYIISGYTILPDEDFTDALLVKVDAMGQVQWMQNYGGRDPDGLNCVQPTADGGFLALGGTESFGAGGLDFYLLRVDSDGNELWHKTFGGRRDDRAFFLQITSDGGAILCGSTQNSATDRQAYLIKVDASGNEIWSRDYGGAGGEVAYCVRQTPDGGYVFAGSSTSFRADDFDAYLVKTDGNGNVQWEKHYGGTDWEEARAVALTGDGGYVLAGYTASSGAGGRDMYLIKVDENGDLQWSQTFGEAHNDGAGDVKPTSDGGYILVGSLTNYFTTEKQYTDIFLVKTDAQGNLQWSRTFGGDKSEGAGTVQLAADGGYILAGTTNSYSKSSDIYLLKVDEQGTLTSIKTMQASLPTGFQLAQNYPNPFNGSTVIRFSLPVGKHVRLAVYDILGREVAELADGYRKAGQHRVVFNAASLTTGLYLYRLHVGNQTLTRRMIYLR